MKELNEREKNLAVVTAMVVIFTSWAWAGKIFKARTDAIQQQLRSAEGRLAQAQALLAGAPEPAVASTEPPHSIGDSRLTLTLLKDLTVPPESSNIRVTGLDRSGDNGFRLTLQGKFPEVMRFLSYLERSDSRFNVTHAELEKIKEAAAETPSVGSIRETETAEAAREVRGTFQLQLRGAA